MIRVHTDELDYSDIPDQDYDWVYSTYGNAKEVKPSDAPNSSEFIVARATIKQIIELRLTLM